MLSASGADRQVQGLCCCSDPCQKSCIIQLTRLRSGSLLFFQKTLSNGNLVKTSVNILFLLMKEAVSGSCDRSRRVRGITYIEKAHRGSRLDCSQHPEGSGSEKNETKLLLLSVCKYKGGLQAGRTSASQRLMLTVQYRVYYSVT